MTFRVVLAVLAATMAGSVGEHAPEVASPAPHLPTVLPLTACLVCDGTDLESRRPALITWGTWRRGLPRFRCVECRTTYVVRGVLSGVAELEPVRPWTRA